MRTGVVFEEYIMCMQGGHGFAGETVKIMKLRLQGSSSWCTGFLCCVQVLLCVEHIDMLYMSVCVYYNNTCR